MDVLAGEEGMDTVRHSQGEHPIIDRSAEQVTADRRRNKLLQNVTDECEELRKNWEPSGMPDREIAMRLSIAEKAAQRRLEVRVQQLETRAGAKDPASL